MIFRVGRFQALAIRQNPDLQEMHRLGWRRIEFAVCHAGAGGHVLNFTGPDDAAIAHRILVLQRAAQNVGDDFHVASVSPPIRRRRAMVSSLITRSARNPMCCGSK